MSLCLLHVLSNLLSQVCGKHMMEGIARQRTMKLMLMLVIELQPVGSTAAEIGYWIEGDAVGTFLLLRQPVRTRND
jgi:hypothetical protein